MEKDYKKVITNKRLEAGNLMTKDQIIKCNIIIHTASVASGAAGGIPILVADALPITAAQITMTLALSKVFDQEITKATAYGMIAAAASTFVGRNLIKMVPIAGWVASATVAAGVTEAIGWTIAVDFASMFRKEWERRRNAKEAADAYAENEKYKRAAEKYNEDAEDFNM